MFCLGLLDAQDAKHLDMRKEKKKKIKKIA